MVLQKLKRKNHFSGILYFYLPHDDLHAVSTTIRALGIYE
jgi:hypothetical protein